MSGDERTLGIVEREGGPDAAGFAHEQLHRPALLERRHRVLLLASQPQGTPRRAEHDGRRLVEQLGDHVRRVRQLLEVVEHEQRRPRRHECGDDPHGRIGAAVIISDAERARDRHPRVADAHRHGEVDEVDAPGDEASIQRGGRSEGERGLAHTARSGERHQTGTVDDELGDAVDVAGAADQVGPGRRQVGGRPEALDRRRDLGEPVHQQLEQLLRRRQVLQPVQAEVAVPLAADRVVDGGADDDLPAVGRRRDAGGAVQLESDVALLMAGQVAAVQPHPDADGGVADPRMGDERPLRIHSGGDAVGGLGEDHEEAVALGPHLPAAVGGDGGAEDASLVGEHRRVPVAQPAEVCGRALDVGEQHRHPSLGEGRHADSRADQALVGCVARPRDVNAAAPGPVSSASGCSRPRKLSNSASPVPSTSTLASPSPQRQSRSVAAKAKPLVRRRARNTVPSFGAPSSTRARARPG